MTALQLPFTGGIDQRIADEYVDPSSRVIDVVNARFAKDGAIDKRYGAAHLTDAQLSGDPAMGAPLRLISRGSELARIDGDALHSYSPSLQKWAYRSLVSPCVATRDHLFTNTASYTAFAVVETTTARVVAYRDIDAAGGLFSGNVFASIYDVVTGAPIVVNLQLTTGSTYWNPILCLVANRVYLFYADATHIYGRALDPTTMQWSAPTAIVSDAASQIYDATPYATGDGVYILYPQNAGAGNTTLKFLYLNALPALSITASASIETTANTVTLCAARATASLAIWFAWETNTGGGTHALRAAAYSADGLYTVLAAPFALTALTISAGALILAVEILSASRAIFINYQSTAIYTTAGAYVTVQHYPLGFIGSRPFVANGRCYLVFLLGEEPVTSGAKQATYYVVDTRAYETNQLPRVVATLAPRQANYNFGAYNIVLALDPRPAGVTNIGVTSAAKYRMLLEIQISEEIGNTLVTFVDLATLDFSGAAAWQSTEALGETYASGGVPSFYDGAGAQELGFFCWPTATASVTSTVTGALTAGLYGYAFVYAHVDSAGLIHRSAAYKLSVTTSTATCTVTTTFPNIPYTNRYAAGRTPVVEIYRTGANGTTYYYLTAVTCESDNNNDSLSYVDTTADVTIATNAVLYTTGGVLDAVNPPSMRCMIAHKERLWGIDDTGFVVWYSTAFNVSDAPYFNEALTLSFAHGPLTALAALDDKLVVCAADRIWIVYGDGPANTGQGSDLQASPLAADTGAVDWRSVVSTPVGVFFMGQAGMYLLGRDLTVQFVGQSVQDLLPAGASITSAVLVAAQHQVRWTLGTGVVVFFDYTWQRWGRHVYAVDAGHSNAIQCAALASSAWVMGISGVWSENPTSYKDTTTAGASVFVPLSVVTGWIKLQGLQGYQRARRVLAYARTLEAHDLAMTLAFDYGIGSTQSQSWTKAVLAGSSAVVDQVDLHVQAASTKCQSLQITLADATPTGGGATTGQGARFLGVAVDVQAIGDRYRKLPASVKG